MRVNDVEGLFRARLKINFSPHPPQYIGRKTIRTTWPWNFPRDGHDPPRRRCLKVVRNNFKKMNFHPFKPAEASFSNHLHAIKLNTVQSSNVKMRKEMVWMNNWQVGSTRMIDNNRK